MCYMEQLIEMYLDQCSETPEIDRYWEDRNPSRNQETVNLLAERGYKILATGTLKKNDLPVVVVYDERFKLYRTFYTSIVTPYPKLAGENNSINAALELLNDGWKEYQQHEEF